MFDIYQSAVEAEKTIRQYVKQTPLDFSHALSKQLTCNVYFKCENLQHTGAFKVRGAFNKLLALQQAGNLNQGVVTASSGNHGAAVAYGCHTLHVPGKVFVPENASSTKIANIKQYAIALEHYGAECLEAEREAQRYANVYGMHYISPYNDPDIIAGQGTIGLELARQLQQIDAVIVPVGGGGLIAGIAGVIKKLSPTSKVIGAQPKNSPVMAESIKVGRIIEMPSLPTLSDGSAGGIESDSITFEICQQYVDDYILVSEAEIKAGIKAILETQHQLIEGAAGVAVAALMQQAENFKGKNVVVILCGANISLDTLREVICNADSES